MLLLTCIKLVEVEVVMVVVPNRIYTKTNEIVYLVKYVFI